MRNVHERLIPASPKAVGALVDSLAGPDDRVWPKGRWPRIGRRVTVRVGKPFVVRADELAPGDRRAAKTAATERIMREIAALLPPEQRGAYGDAPASGTGEPGRAG